jgi:serine protease Do
VGFSIPINLIRRIATDLIQKGAVTRAYLGISTEGVYPQLDPLLAVKFGLPNGRGGLVQEVFPETPAAAAGLEPLDVILQINEVPVEDIYHLTHTISLKPVGEKVALLVWRNRQQLRLDATLAARPKRGLLPLTEQQNPVPVLARMGVDVQDLTDADRLRFDLRDLKGVLIKQVSPHREAARLVEPFDVIEEVEGRPVDSTAAMREIIMSVKSDKGIRVRIARPTPQGITHQDVTIKP